MSVLALGSLADPTYCHTVQRMQSLGVPVAHIDYPGLIRHLGTQLNFDDPLDSVIEIPGYGLLRFAQFAGIYARAVPSEFSNPDHDDSYHEAECALGEFLTYAGLQVMNPPIAAPHNNAKILHQAAVAAAGGFRAPATIVTTLRMHALTFHARHYGRVISKGASGLKTWARLVTDPNDLTITGDAPALLQEWVPGPEVRAHVVGFESVFAEEITTDAVDYRNGAFTARPIELSPRVAEGCRRIARWLELPLVGIDLRMNGDSGDVVALEANPCPAYEGYDRRLNGAISEAIASWLLHNTVDTLAR